MSDTNIYTAHIKYRKPRKVKGYDVTKSTVEFAIKKDAIKFADGHEVLDISDEPRQLNPETEKVTKVVDQTGKTIYQPKEKDTRFPVGKQFHVSGHSDEMWIEDYDVNVNTTVTIEEQPHTNAKKVLVTLDEIDGDHNVTTFINKRFLH